MQQVVAYRDFLALNGPLVALAASLAMIALFVGRATMNKLSGKRPPIFEDVPFIGGVMKFAKGPMPLMEEGYRRFGEVFTVPVLHKRVTFLIGPDVSPHFFKASDNEMSQTEVYGYSVPTFGKGVVFDVDQKVRSEQFRFFTEALTKERLKSYVPLFIMEAENFFSKWGDEGAVDLKEQFDRLITLTATRTLLGREIREQMFEEVTTLLHHLDEGMTPISVFFPYLPTANHKKRDRARAELGRLFAKVIKARRASGTREVDVLQQFIDAKYKSVYGGRELTEEEITGLLIATLFAGQHTSTITASWTGYHMIAEKAGAFMPALDEQRTLMKEHGEEITFERLGEMEVLQRNITEALRMHPPLILVLRYARTSFQVTDSKGNIREIPQGDIVAASPNFSHMLPHVFSNPQKYDPDRWAPPRQEDKKKPYSWIGFGAGRHGCLGEKFAYLQIKTIWSVLLRNFDFEILDPIPDPDYDSMVIGPKPCRVRYTRRKLTV